MESFISREQWLVSGEDGKKPWIFCDLDDTILGLMVDGKLELNEKAYHIALDAFCTLMNLELGAGRDDVLAMQYDIDSALCKEFGFEDPNRFAHSLIQCFDRLFECVYSPSLHYERIKNVCWNLGTGVFDYEFVPLPGAMATLETLSKDFRIAIVTKGNDKVQTKKAIDSGVIVYAEEFCVVSFKNYDDWRGIFFDRLKLSEMDLRKSWAIGNSAKSDVNVPLQFGCNGIHLQTGGWKFEVADLGIPAPGQIALQVPQIGDVLKVLYPNNYMVIK